VDIKNEYAASEPIEAATVSKMETAEAEGRCQITWEVES